MARASEILALAWSQLGIAESPAGSNTVTYNTAYYGREISGSAYPWCVVFLWWLFAQCGADALFYGGKKTASSTTLYHYYSGTGQLVHDYTQAQAGDIVFFTFNATDKKQGIKNHVGICVEVDADGNMVTIDGNTYISNDADGGSVMRRVRSMSDVTGVARPKYDTEVTELTQEQVRTIVREEMEAVRKAEAIAAATVSPWAADAWRRAVEQGLFDGSMPGGVLTREQAAMVIGRLEAADG